MSSFSRPSSGFRFSFAGMKLTAAPDALPEHYSPYAKNIRAYTDTEVTSRPFVEQVTAGPFPPLPVLSLEPTIGVYKIGTQIYYNGAVVDSGYSSRGASITPFRPNSSPNVWEYIWDDNKATKVYIGSPNVVANTGIAEPQAPVEAYVSGNNLLEIFDAGAAPAQGGTAAAPVAAAAGADTVQSAFVLGGLEEYIGVTSLSYRRWQAITIHSEYTTVLDIFPAAPAMDIESIYYYSGTTGRCVIVPKGLGPAPGVLDTSVYDPLFIQAIRRGALVQIDSEVCVVLGVSVGPAGSIAFEVNTTVNHTAASTMVGLPGIKVRFVGATAGDAIATDVSSWTSAVTTGIGSLTWTPAFNPFNGPTSPFQKEDYIHFTFKVDVPGAINEVKILFDVNNGAANFTDNFYYYTARANDLIPGINNTTTQLGAAQLIAQRALIDAEAAIEVQNQGTTASSAQLTTGTNQYAEVVFPISALTRVGNQQTQTLKNLNSVQVLVNANANVNVFIGGFYVTGGGFLDVGNTGIPIQYVIRPRSSVTGARGNRCPVLRYTVSPRRDNVNIALPTTYPDPQMDTWDIFRMGATLDKFRYVGSATLGATQFIDTNTDIAISNNPELETDNYQPFPSIGPPVVGTGTATGHTMLATFPLTSSPSQGTLSQMTSLLPGNFLNIGQNAYTLWTRPTTISTTLTTQTLLFQTVENMGTQTPVAVNIYEPQVAAQANFSVWGPDANGVFFAVQDPLRPGVISRTNPNNPDSASDANTDDLCPPSEPLQNGELLGGTSFVFSTKRAWRGYPQNNGKYNWVEIPVGRGLISPFPICSDGSAIYYWASDGIRATSGGASVSLTDADLYPLFPHEGSMVVPSITYNGNTVYAPDYSKADLFRLCVCNGFLYADYQSIDGVYRNLVMDIKRKAWVVDENESNPFSIHAATTNPAQNGGTVLQQLYLGHAQGSISIESITGSGSTDCVLCLREESYGDIRAPKIFGDASFDVLAQVSMTVQPLSSGAAVPPATLINAGARTQSVVQLGADQLITRFLGCQFSWTEASGPSVLYSWQPSYITQPEATAERFTDWDDAEYSGLKWMQGFLLEANTGDTPKVVLVRDNDTLATHDFSSDFGLNTIQANGQSTHAYSFVQPFYAHSVRLEPQDATQMQQWKIKWVWEPSPELAMFWTTQRTSLGLEGWIHNRQMVVAHRSTADLILTIQSDAITNTYNIPNSGGFFTKTIVNLSGQAKALLHSYSITSAEPFAIADNDQEVLVKSWSDNGGYRRIKLPGSTSGAGAKI